MSFGTGEWRCFQDAVSGAFTYGGSGNPLTANAVDGTTTTFNYSRGKVSTIVSEHFSLYTAQCPLRRNSGLSNARNGCRNSPSPAGL